MSTWLNKTNPVPGEEPPVNASTAIWYCRFCGDRAVAIYKMDEGCQCYPEDREQALCPQHVISANPISSMELVHDLTGGVWSKFMDEYY